MVEFDFYKDCAALQLEVQPARVMHSGGRTDNLCSYMLASGTKVQPARVTHSGGRTVRLNASVFE